MEEALCSRQRRRDITAANIKISDGWMDGSVRLVAEETDAFRKTLDKEFTEDD